MITKRLKPYEKQIIFVERGQIDIAGATLARGRIDRYNWEATQNQPAPFIDSHCHNTSMHNEERKQSFLKVFVIPREATKIPAKNVNVFLSISFSSICF